MTGKIIAFCLALALAVLVMLWVRKFLLIDACLDRGGRWNYTIGECEESRR
jgi:hypothetical protein